jgi:hypothetical protein
MGTRGGWAPDVQQSGVRPDYGLSTVTGIGQTAKSPYERTLRPGEERSSEELRDMLAEVILAAGAGVVPGVGPKGQARRVPGGRGSYRQRMSALDEQIKMEKRSSELSKTEAAQKSKMSEFDVYSKAYERGVEDAREGYKGALENPSLGNDYPFPDVYRRAYGQAFMANARE